MTISNLNLEQKAVIDFFHIFLVYNAPNDGTDIGSGQLKLKGVANIVPGAFFRSGVKPVADGELQLIQMRDLGADHLVHLEGAARINYYMKTKIDCLAQPGDILFRSRGLNYTAAIYEGKEERAIVAAPLLLVRPNKGQVVPRYLLWWLNQPSSQHYFVSHAEGSAVQMISKVCLEHLEVSLPPLNRQRSLAAYFDLAEREKVLLRDIQRLRAKHAQGVLMCLAKTSPSADNTNLGAGTVASLLPQPTSND